MRRAAGLSLLGGSGALLALSLFYGGGTSQDRLFWIGAAASLLAGLGVAGSELGATGRIRLDGQGRAALALGLAFLAWSGAGLGWSIAPDRTWAFLNRGLVYLAFFALGLLVAAASPRARTATALGLATLLLGVVGWALLGKVFPGLFPDGGRVARLRSPVGYWNALAFLCALAFPLGLWVVTDRRRPGPVRAAGSLLLYLAAVALVLTFSRGGLVVAAVAVLLWLWATEERLESLGALVAATVPAAAVAGWATTRAGLVDDLQPSPVRAADGRWLALVLVLGAVVALALSYAADRSIERLDPASRRAWGPRLGGALLAVALAGAVAYAAASGGPERWLDEFRGSGEVSQGSARLAELSSNNRWSWWQEAWTIFLRHPGQGTGAGTFEIARRPLRQSDVVTTEPHNLALQALAEMGMVGLSLGLAASLAALAACRRALTCLHGEERRAGLALATVVPLYLLHALFDIDWDLVATSAPAFFVAGVLLGSGQRQARSPARPLRAMAALALGCALTYSLAAPWLASRRVDDAYLAIERGDPERAVASARQARWLDPFSTEPLVAWALASAASGDVSGALRRYAQAVELQPKNSSTWYDLGAFELAVGRYRAAYRHLDRAYGLDPYGPAGQPGGLLDQARAKVEGR
ncbi:MAG: hypothetical protein C4306_01830 [Thermoleophilia bacterium]